MTTYLNIRGTNGVGKTTMARQFFPLGTMNEHTLRRMEPTNTPYHDLGEVWLLGRYDRATCGGCDTIKTQDEICTLLRLAGSRNVPLVVFEGLLLSGLWTRYYKLTQELEQQNHTVWWAFPQVSADEAIRRTNQRRAERGKGPLENTRNLLAKHKSVQVCYERAKAHGLRVLDLSPNAGESRRQLLALEEIGEYLL